MPKPLLNDPIDDYYEPVYTLYITQEDMDGFMVVTSMLQPEIKMASDAIKYLGLLFKETLNSWRMLAYLMNWQVVVLNTILMMF